MPSYLNAYARYETYDFGAGIFQDQERIAVLQKMATYISDMETRLLLLSILSEINLVEKDATALAYGAYEFYNKGIIDEAYFNIYQLRDSILHS
jgi:hypothetical protein